MDILCDYKVIVLAVEESHINRQLQGLLKDENNSLKVDDAAKLLVVGKLSLSKVYIILMVQLLSQWNVPLLLSGD